jgi:hypothetical protein
MGDPMDFGYISGMHLLTSIEAAHRLHICTKTLRKLRRDGAIRYVALTNRKILYRPEDCDEFVQSRLRKMPDTLATSRKGGRAIISAGGDRIVSFTQRRAFKAKPTA